jgi:hypothetical protein
LFALSAARVLNAAWTTKVIERGRAAMPTSVDRLLDRLQNFIDRNGPAIADAAQDIDGDLTRLLNAGPDAFRSILHERDVHHDFQLLGRTFLWAGNELHAGAEVAEQVDRAVLRAFGIQRGDPVPGPQKDFLALDRDVEETVRDLRHTGHDFLKLGTAHTPDAFAARLGELADDFGKLANDVSADSGALGKLGEDVVQLAGLPLPSATQHALTEFGGDLQTVATGLQGLAGDFGVLSTAPTPAAVGAAVPPLLQDLQALAVQVVTLAPVADALLQDLPHAPHGNAAQLTSAHG